jgi:hypothetical protein
MGVGALFCHLGPPLMAKVVPLLRGTLFGPCSSPKSLPRGRPLIDQRRPKNDKINNTTTINPIM